MLFVLTPYPQKFGDSLNGRKLCTKMPCGSLLLALQAEDLQKADGIILDLLDADFSAGHILGTVQWIRSMYERLPIVVIAHYNEADRHSRQLRHALEHTFHCTVFTDYKLEPLREVFPAPEQPEPTKHSDPNKLTAKSSTIPTTLEKIVVAGSLPRCGCTTQAIAVCRCLQEWGVLPLLRESRPIFIPEQQGGIQTIAGVSVARIDTPVPRGLIVVQDAGVVSSSEQIQKLRQKSPVILCGGSKPWEFRELARLLGGVQQCCDGLIISFDAAARGMEHIRKLVACPVLAAPWRPDLLIKKQEEGMDAFLRQVLNLQEEMK